MRQNKLSECLNVIPEADFLSTEWKTPKLCNTVIKQISSSILVKIFATDQK